LQSGWAARNSMQRSPSWSGVASRSLLETPHTSRIFVPEGLKQLTICSRFCLSTPSKYLATASSLSFFPPPALRNAFWIRFGLVEATAKATDTDTRHAKVVIWMVLVIAIRFYSEVLVRRLNLISSIGLRLSIGYLMHDSPMV
jgi:hypothetical protein